MRMWRQCQTRGSPPRRCRPETFETIESTSSEITRSDSTKARGSSVRVARVGSSMCSSAPTLAGPAILSRASALTLADPLTLGRASAVTLADLPILSRAPALTLADPPTLSQAAGVTLAGPLTLGRPSALTLADPLSSDPQPSLSNSDARRPSHPRSMVPTSWRVREGGGGAMALMPWCYAARNELGQLVGRLPVGMGALSDTAALGDRGTSVLERSCSARDEG